MSKSSQIKKRQRRSRIPESKQSEVVARKLSGQSERPISRETGISRQAIARIATGSEYRDIVQRHRPEALELVPDSLKVIKKALTETLNPQGDPEPEQEKFGKIEVLDGKDLRRKLDDAYRRGYRQGLKRGSDGLKAALGSVAGTGSSLLGNPSKSAWTKIPWKNLAPRNYVPVSRSWKPGERRS